MIAYNQTWLNNLFFQNEATEASENNLITPDELKSVKEKYPVAFYTPNPFIRTGLFILTGIIASFVLGLFSLMFLSAINENSYSALIIFQGILCYIALEVMVRSKNHYRSGVDDALMLMCMGFIICGLNFITNVSTSGNALMICLLSAWMWIRFSHMLMSAVTFISLLAFIFLSYIQISLIARATAPFLLMAVSLGAYLIARAQSKKSSMRIYHASFAAVEFLALLCLCFAGNYFVVREAGNSMLNMGLREGESIPYGWLFWIFTVLIPVIYIFYGVYKKNTLLLRAGILMIAFMVFTIRFYYYALPVEVLMTIAGALMILAAYLLIRYLKEPKHGFTYKEASRKHLLDKLQLEALIITETMGAPQHSGGDIKFGGGSGGGGGASGNY